VEPEPPLGDQLVPRRRRTGNRLFEKGSRDRRWAIGLGPTPYGAAEVSHVNLNAGVVEGIRLRERPVFAVQYHPEAAPGPHDAVDLFDQFRALMDGEK
jgi:carbamoylphosphate synthase small subunit